MALVLDGTLGIAITGDSTITQNFTIPQNLIVGSGGSISTNNGSVDKVLNIYGGNNVVVGGVSTNVGFGLCLEASRTGRASTARFAQISLGSDASDNGSILFYTAPSGSGVSERMRIDSAGRFTLNSQPFFYATLTVAQTGYNSASTGDVVVIYNSTTTNTGSHYNTATGKFTAPVAGNYIFHASAYASGSSFQQNWLVVNGSRITGTDWVHASSTMSLGFWLIKLAANDTVGFHAYNGGVTSTTINTNSEHTYFRGYLLS